MFPQAVVDRFGQSSALDDTSIIATLPAAVRRVVLEGFADSMSTVFLTVAVLLVPAFVLSLFIEEIPLRATGGLAAARAGEPEQAEAVRSERAVR